MAQVNQHTTVLLEEAVAGLAIKANGVYIDGTFGRGGHAKRILETLGPQGKLFGIDKDPAAISAGQGIQQQDKRLTMYQGSFATVKQLATEHAIEGKVDGVLLDLGVSSPQLDDASRGFSFLRDGPLDMRMDPTRGMSAADWLNSAEQAEIADVLKRFGEERFGKRIAHAICERRVEQPLKTTFDLVSVIEQALPVKDKHKHPATRSFQGIRIFINQELADLEQALEQILAILAPGGRMSIISFHSLEDRMVKRFMKKHAKGDEYPSDFPIQEHLLNKKLKLVGKAIKPSKAELEHNVRSRSAVLRVAEKLS